LKYIATREENRTELFHPNIWLGCERVVKTWLIRSALVAVILPQIWWAVVPVNFAPRPSAQSERAAQAYQMNPSAETKAALFDQMRRDASRSERNSYIMLGLMLVADVVAVYFLWNYEAKKPAA